jgi:hypothetical protein
MAAVWALDTAEVVIVKVAPVAPGGTVIFAGKVAAVLSLVKESRTPPSGAG